MNILFIHGNFPGQFKDIAPSLARNNAGKIYFLTLSDNPQNIQLPGVHLRQFKLHRDVSNDIHDYVRSSELAVLKGQAVLRALNQLHQQEGYVPDVVVCHGGMGFGLFVKALFPKVRLFSYVEWFFKIEHSMYLFADPSLNDYCRLQLRNLPVLQECVEVDKIICPTEWQRSQFPDFIRERVEVIFDGIDLDFFCPGPPADPFILNADSDTPLRFTSDQLLLTYGTRGMESLRGFPEFMRAAAVAQQRYPNLHVIVFGNDRAPYSYPSSHPSGSWKQYMLEELDGELDLNRLHFTGLINYGELIQLFRRSDLHCYFTRHYVVSWGVFQAAACGARLLVNDFPGLDEVFCGDPYLTPVSLDDQSQVTSAVLSGIKSFSRNQHILLADGLDLKTSVSKWKKVLYNSW